MAVKNLGGNFSESSGLGTQLGILYTDRRDFYIRPNVTKELWKTEAPFVTDLVSKGSIKVPDPDFKMFEHRAGWTNQQFVVNGVTTPFDTYVPGDLAVLTGIDGIKGLSSTVDSSYIGLVVEVWNSDKSTYKGISLITAVVAGGAVTLKSLGNPRSTANTHSALADNDICFVIGNAWGEETSAPDAFADEIEVVYNSAQIFKTAVNITGTLAEATSLRGYNSELARLRADKAKEHKIQVNKALLLGVRTHGTGMTDLAGDNTFTDGFATHITDANGKLVRTTMGIIPAIYKYGANTGDFKNIFTIGAVSYDYAAFVEDSEYLFQYGNGGGVKTAYCGMGALSYWSKLSSTGFYGNSGVSVSLSDWSLNKAGFNVKYLETPHGMLELKYEPALRGQYRNSMVIVDPSNVDHCIYRPHKFMTNIKTDNAYDGIKDMYFSDEGIGIQLIESHAIMNVVDGQ